jgi:hypothetical protein
VNNNSVADAGGTRGLPLLCGSPSASFLFGGRLASHWSAIARPIISKRADNKLPMAEEKETPSIMENGLNQLSRISASPSIGVISRQLFRQGLISDDNN